MQKYKVFLNEKGIVFAPNSNITLSEPSVDLTKVLEPKRFREWLRDFCEGMEKETVLEHHNPGVLFENFKSAFKIIDAAGGVVVRSSKILFIFRNGKWDLPKGKIDKGEDACEAAIREVGEECGINGHNIVKQLPSTHHIYQSPYKDSIGQWIFKETFWYEMEYSGADDGIPQHEEGITRVCWFGRDELDEVLNNTYENLKQIINLYLA